MRVIEREMINAIKNGKDWHKANTSVSIVHQGIHGTPSYRELVEVRLYNHPIAIIEKSINQMNISSCGFETSTTKSRLNALLRTFSNRGIHQNNYNWYLNGEEFVDNTTVPFN